MKQLQVLLAVVDFKRPNLSRYPSAAYLAFVAGLSVDEFDETLKRLEEKGYVRVSGDNNGLDISIAGLLSAIRVQAGD